MTTQWDYKTVVLTGGFMGRHKDGYELCWVLMEQALQKEKDGHVLIFKRPLPPS